MGCGILFMYMVPWGMDLEFQHGYGSFVRLVLHFRLYILKIRMDVGIQIIALMLPYISIHPHIIANAFCLVVYPAGLL